jgi:hypothetical protein
MSKLENRKNLTVINRPDLHGVVARYDGGQFMISISDAEFVAREFVMLLPEHQRALIATLIISSLLSKEKEQEKYFDLLEFKSNAA